MSSTSHRKSVLSRLTVPLTALLLGACGDSTATSETDTDSGSSGSTGDDSTTDDTPTTGNTDTGVPSEGEARYFLRIDDTPVPPVKLEMNRAKVLEVFGEPATKKIKLLDVDSKPLLQEVLARIQSSCGTAWDDYDAGIPNNKLPVDPKHDCSLTELGKTFGPGWKTSPQFQMVRLLTMTARNARVGGTVMNDMEKLFGANQNNFGEFSFQDVLAASLFCPYKDGEDAMTCTDKLMSSDPAEAAQEKILHVRPFISTEILAETLKTTLMQSHPNIANPDGKLPVTLYDALHDMKPLADKFGPTDDHPGLLMHDDADNDGVDEFTTYSDALTSGFKMVAIAESNLRLVDGIDASVGAGSMFVSIAEAPLAFDFMDEDKVQLLGIAPNPIVDMRMRIAELDGNVPSCDGTKGDAITACKTNLPEMPLGGDKYIWGKPLWSLERIIAQAAYTSFKDRIYTRCFVNFDAQTCLTDAKIGVNGDPKGWTVFFTELDTPKFPPPQFFWEMLLDVAQETLHDFTGPDVEDADKDGNKTELTARADGKLEIQEGQLNPVFALKGLPIGLTAEQMIAEIRPNLQAQAPFIANVILGKFWKHNAHLDFYYRRVAPNAPPALFFVHASDPRPDTTGDALAPYTYKNPGFFADAELTTKLSSTKLDGVDGITETDHEKLLLSPGETVLYIQDDEDKLHRLRFYVPEGGDPTEIVVHVHAL